jgi:hypothetical protein
MTTVHYLPVGCLVVTLEAPNVVCIVPVVNGVLPVVIKVERGDDPVMPVDPDVVPPVPRKPIIQ